MSEQDNSKLQQTTNNSLSKGKKIGMPLWQRVQHIPKQQEANVIELPNRIGLLLDVSGSMSGKSIEDLRKAYDSFMAAANFADTCIAVAHFGYKDDAAQDVPLTIDSTRLMLVGISLHANGGTPMGSAMERMITSQPVTRCVLISDGDPTDSPKPDDQAQIFKQAGVACDCVHIGNSVGGEAQLQRIAEITGGIYMKFKDTGNFAKAFAYLTPAGRALMLNGQVDTTTLGADDIKFIK